VNGTQEAVSTENSALQYVDVLNQGSDVYAEWLWFKPNTPASEKDKILIQFFNGAIR
jgi:hypothetical protein